MISKEDIERLSKEMGGNQEVGVYAAFSEDCSQMKLNVFTMKGRPLSVADVLLAIGNYQCSVLTEKINGNLRAGWGPGDVQGKPTSPAHAPRTGKYWGG